MSNSASAILDAAGHRDASEVPRPTPSAVQISSPSAAPGFIPNPSGSLIRTSRICEGSSTSTPREAGSRIVKSAPVGRAYDAYSERALPFFGRIIARDAESYRYLHESIRRFPAQRVLAERMRKAGFANVAWRDMTLGVVALHSGWRI